MTSGIVMAGNPRVASGEKSTTRLAQRQWYTLLTPNRPLHSCCHRSNASRHRPIQALPQPRGILFFVRRSVVANHDIGEVPRSALDSEIQYANCSTHAKVRSDAPIHVPHQSQRRHTYGKVREHHLPRTIGAMRQATPRVCQSTVEVAAAVPVTVFVTRVAGRTERRLHARTPPEQPRFV